LPLAIAARRPDTVDTGAAAGVQYRSGEAQCGASPHGVNTMQGCAYVDGRFVAPEDAKISIFDWGFLHSDATYDVAHVWQGKFFRLDDHLDRFFASMDRLRLDPGKTRAEVRAVMHGCVRRAGLTEAYVEVLCTRGRPQPGRRSRQKGLRTP
jgi:branched-subunit amino acid aminotransferase/4-amino-4-deoxychorismate lyase